MLEVKNVKIEYYGDITTLNVSFNVGITLILGEIGSFKTSLLRIIGGIKEIEEGEIVLDGKNIEELSPKARDIILVSADTMPFGGKVKNILIKPLTMRGINKDKAKSMVEQAVNLFALDMEKRTKKLSKKELISFFRARLYLRNTEITLFDEPYHLLGDDEAITEMIRSRGGYTIVTSCDGSDIKKLKPDHIIVCRRDKILQQGPMEQVLSSPVDKYTQLLLDM